MQVPAPFEYRRASSVDEALTLLESLGEEARVIAGGHSLLPMMKLRLARPEYLIDINDLDDLDYLRVEGDELRVGALTRHRALLESELVGRYFPIVQDAERVIADPPVRNRGTIGGSLCQADPSEDLSAVCTALRAVAVVRGRAGVRAVPMAEFYRGPYETAVGAAEMLVEIRLLILPEAGSAYEKVERKAGDWAVAAAGVALALREGRIDRAGIGLAALGGSTVSMVRAEEALTGRQPTEETFAEAGRITAEDCDPVTDGRGTAAYKRHLAGELTVRALRRAAERAGAASRTARAA
ncbi:xanthine dehydrogenase family protein subunit M [Streptacidiphilus sp. PB12-B1b]|uniref:FAD binding domain-containing protein n=1 Tax=Streptacidiphilus sp. PB12-B1b TaxID=2705012 RepID=UPI0015FD3C58|nr:xanthine dehydrogenase family protein subunit M [Streptacidiphilus sp. PB12-B1b]QMU77860.1 xanthine dehydrogenase family protein subunit M [Streptacidiphilus sp. PB12-B1b]